MIFEEALRAVLRDEMRAVVREELRALKSEPQPDTETVVAEFISVAEAATLTGYSSATIRSILRKGQVRRQGTPRAVRIRRSELVDFMQRGVEQENVSADEAAIAILGRQRAG